MFLSILHPLYVLRCNFSLTQLENDVQLHFIKSKAKNKTYHKINTAMKNLEHTYKKYKGI